jgi:transcription initiation factor TFIIE subunit alpha
VPAEAEKKTSELDPTLKNVLIDFGGEDAIKILSVLLKLGNNDEITDEKLAEQSSVKLNIVRKILYILNENKLTCFHRQRDKKSGWFVYYWKSCEENLGLLLEERKKQVLEKLSIRLKFEEDNLFFLCDHGCLKRFVFVDAMESDFKCPVCNQGKLEADNNKETVKFLKEKIVSLRNQ